MNQNHPFRTLSAILLTALLGWGAYPNIVKAASWSFAVLGDQRDVGSYGINQPIVTAMAAQIASQTPAFVLAGGDQIRGMVDSTCDPLAEQYTHWKTAMAPILSITYPIRGNHETYGEVNTLGPDYAKNWMDNIANVLTQIPKNGPTNEVGMTYSFSKNNAFIIGLDQDNVTAPQQVNQPWLNQQIAANNLPFTFVYGHYPAFAVDPTENSLADHQAARDAFWKSLGDSSVNIYFAGHNHMYNRAEVSINGGPEIQQIVIGTGGALLGSWDGTYNDKRVIWESNQESSYGYTLVTVNGNKITAVYYIYNSTTNSWSAYDTYSYTLTSRKFGANDANQSIDPATLTNYYQDIRLLKIGLGTLTLNSGTSTYADTITVSAGGLNVQGDYSSAPVTVQSGAQAILSDAGKVGGVTVDSGGTLSGTGTVVGSLTNSGTVSPGNSPGTLSVVGSYTQTTAGTYQAEIAAATEYDKINVTGVPGTATLAGTLAPMLLGGYPPARNQVFPGIITTTGGVIGTFSSVANQQITPILAWQPRYNTTSVDLVAAPDFANPGLPLTANLRRLGAMLNGVNDRAGGDLGTVLDTLCQLPTGGAVADTYKQISPEKAGALSTLAFAGATFQMRNLAQRITDVRFGSREAGVMSGLPGAFGLNYSRAEGMMLAFNSSNLAGLLTSKKAAAPETKWGIYLDPSLILGSQGSTVGQTGFNFNIAGFNAGADYRVRNDLLVGLATGYSHSGANFRGSGGGMQTNTWPLTAYAAYLPQSFYAYGSLGYALNLFNLERQIGFGGLNRTANSSTTGNQLNAYGEAGYDLKVKPFMVTPVVSLAYSGIWVDSFTENGAGALNLKVLSQNAASVQTGVGAKVAAPLKRGPVTVVPQVYATYQHEFANGSRGLNASLSQVGSTFNFQTDAANKNFAVVGANVTILTEKNLRVQINYNTEVGRGTSSAHSANAGLRWEF